MRPCGHSIRRVLRNPELVGKHFAEQVGLSDKFSAGRLGVGRALPEARDDEHDKDDPSRTIYTNAESLLEPSPELTRPIEHQIYLRDVVFTTGIADGGDHYIVVSGEADLACRITHISKDEFR